VGGRPPLKLRQKNSNSAITTTNLKSKTIEVWSMFHAITTSYVGHCLDLAYSSAVSLRHSKRIRTSSEPLSICFFVWWCEPSPFGGICHPARHPARPTSPSEVSSTQNGISGNLLPRRLRPGKCTRATHQGQKIKPPIKGRIHLRRPSSRRSTFPLQSGGGTIHFQAQRESTCGRSWKGNDRSPPYKAIHEHLFLKNRSAS
jgi:hypothetical protein